MITPTVGRIVHYFPFPGAPAQAAIIAGVHGDRMVNLGLFDVNGMTAPATSIHLRQPEDPEQTGSWCEWMPYQVKKATGSESGEEAAGTEPI